MALHRHHHESALAGQNPARKLDRRTLLKATAAFLATAAAVELPETPSNVTAQDANTVAGEWTQPETNGTGWTTFDAEFAFNAIAPHWPGDPGFDAAVELQLSADGMTWTDSVTVGPAHTDAGPVDRDGRTFCDLLFAELATSVRYRTVDTEGNAVAIPGLTFTYIDARNGPTIDDVMSTSINAKAGPRILSGSQSTLRPPMISRREWGAERAYGGADKGTIWWTPAYQRVRHVIIHHSVTPQFRDPLVEIRSIHYYHTVTRGWGDIGYNYLVDFMGNVYEGRAGGENVVGGHAFQYAHGSAGICTMGNYGSADATPEAIAGLTWISAWAARNLDPLGRSDFHETPNLPTICGHRDVVESTCPGDGLYADLPTVRGAVSDVLNGVRRVLQDPAYSPGQTVQVTVNGANMRAKPGTGQSVVNTLARGTVMHISDGPTTTNGYTWYELTGRRGTGWVASTMFASSNAEPPTGKYNIGNTLEVDTDYLNIRTEPSIRASAVATIPLATRGTVIDGPRPAGGFRWYRLETPYGRGWAVEQYLVIPGQAKPRSRFVVGDFVAVADRDGLRMRSGAGTSNSLVRSLPYGTRGTVVGSGKVVGGLTWLQVTTTLGSGWVAEKYLTSAASGPITSARFERGDRVRIDTDSVNLRQGPGTSQAVIRTLGNGITGTVVDPSSSANGMWWARIQTDYGTGWIAEAFLAERSSESSRTFSIGDAIAVDTDAVKLRTSAGTTARVVTILRNGAEGRIVAGPQSADGYTWYKLETSSNSGWAASNYLARRSSASGSSTGIGVGDLVSVDTDAIRLRERAGLNGTWLATLYSGESALVTGAATIADGYTWVKLRSGTREGWGVTSYLKREGKASLSAGQTARVIEGELNLRSAAGTSSSIVAVLPDGAYVNVTGNPQVSGRITWVRVSSSRYGSGWCAVDYLIRT